MIKVAVIVNGRERPAYALRAGQRILETVYDHEAQTMTVKVESPADSVTITTQPVADPFEGVDVEDWGHDDCYICEEARRRCECMPSNSPSPRPDPDGNCPNCGLKSLTRP